MAPRRPAPVVHQLSISTRLIRLQALRLTKQDRKKNGFIMDELTAEQIAGKRRCQECKKSTCPDLWFWMSLIVAPQRWERMYRSLERKRAL